MNEERLKWALRYIRYHPDLNPSIVSKEWEIDIDEAINICSSLLAANIGEHGVFESDFLEEMQTKIFDKMVSS